MLNRFKFLLARFSFWVVKPKNFIQERERIDLILKELNSKN